MSGSLQGFHPESLYSRHIQHKQNTPKVRAFVSCPFLRSPLVTLILVKETITCTRLRIFVSKIGPFLFVLARVSAGEREPPQHQLGAVSAVSPPPPRYLIVSFLSESPCYILNSLSSSTV